MKDRIFIVGDLHLGLNIDNFITKGKLTSRYEEHNNILCDMVDYIVDGEIEHVIFAGDIFHVANPTSLYRALFAQHLMTLVEHDITVDIVVGNHDSIMSGVSALEPTKKRFEGSGIVHVIDKPTYRDGIVYAPHYNRYEVDYYWKEVFEWAKQADYGVGHFHAAGAVVGAERGLLAGGELTAEKLPPLKRWLLGHIHKPQDFQLSGIPVHYVGSVIRVDFGERDDEKSHILLDTKNDTIKRIPIFYATNYVQVEVNDADIDSYDWSVVSGSIVKVTVDNYSDIHGVREIEDKCKDAVMIKSIQFNRRKQEADRSSEFEAMTYDDILEKYTGDHKLKDRICKHGRLILKESIDEQSA